MNPKLNPQHITRLLTDSTRQLDDTTLTILAQARRSALQKQAMRTSVWALAGHSRWVMPVVQHPWLMAIFLAAVLVAGADFWQANQEQQNCELDVAILTDELPLEVFLD